MIIKIASYWQKNIDLRNTIESSEINPHICRQLIYNKGAKSILQREDSLVNKWCWENWTATCKRIKLDHYLTPCTKINSKLIEDLKVRSKTLRPLEENRYVLFDLSLTNIFLDTSPQARETKVKIIK